MLALYLFNDYLLFSSLVFSCLVFSLRSSFVTCAPPVNCAVHNVTDLLAAVLYDAKAGRQRQRIGILFMRHTLRFTVWRTDSMRWFVSCDRAYNWMTRRTDCTPLLAAQCIWTCYSKGQKDSQQTKMRQSKGVKPSHSFETCAAETNDWRTVVWN